jgi:hypothetical protein
MHAQKLPGHCITTHAEPAGHGNTGNLTAYAPNSPDTEAEELVPYYSLESKGRKEEK